MIDIRYPFNHLGGITRSRYYCFTGIGHTMAAYVDEDGKVDFYDPNIGVASGLSSIRFLSLHFKNSIDVAIMVHGPEKSIKWYNDMLAATINATEYEKYPMRYPF